MVEWYNTGVTTVGNPGSEALIQIIVDQNLNNCFIVDQSLWNGSSFLINDLSDDLQAESNYMFRYVSY